MVTEAKRFIHDLEKDNWRVAARRYGFLTKELRDKGLLPDSLNSVNGHRAKEAPEVVYRHTAFTYYPERLAVVVDGNESSLTVVEDQLLSLFIQRINRMVSLDLISKKLWEEDQDTKFIESNIRLQIRKLRRKLEPTARRDNFKYLVTKRRVGYMLIDPIKLKPPETPKP